MASKKQWRVDIHEPPTAYVTEILVALYSSHLCDLCILCCMSYWVFPNPPVNDDDPLLQRKLRPLKEATKSDTATFLAGIIWTSPPDVELFIKLLCVCVCAPTGDIRYRDIVIQLHCIYTCTSACPEYHYESGYALLVRKKGSSGSWRGHLSAGTMRAAHLQCLTAQEASPGY